MKTNLKSTAVEKLVCQHGDYFCVILGKFTPYSKEGVNCNGVMYPRILNETKTKCRDCQAVPGAYHVLRCTKERCPHCSRRLLACLGRTVTSRQASNS